MLAWGRLRYFLGLKNEIIYVMIQMILATKFIWTVL